MDQVIRTYSILDAARIFGELYTAQALQPDHLNLFKGQPDELESVAPYLFVYESQSEFAGWLREKGWGNSWGVFTECPGTIDDLHAHFKKFLFVRNEMGNRFFRFYDPRVLRKILPGYNATQLKDFFGPVTKFICEGEDPSYALLFSLNNSKLITESVPVGKVFAATAKLEKKGTSLAVTEGTPPLETSVELKASKTPRKFFN